MITRDDLVLEQQSLEVQATQHRETMTRADAVKAAAANRLEAVNGALQMVQHLLTKIEQKQEQKNGEGQTQCAAAGDAGEPGTAQPTPVVG